MDGWIPAFLQGIRTKGNPDKLIQDLNHYYLYSHRSIANVFFNQLFHLFLYIIVHTRLFYIKYHIQIF